MKFTKLTYLFLLTAAVAMAMTGCIEDGFTTSPSDTLAFSADTLDIGTVYTDELTVTSRFTVYNRHSKSLNISDIALKGENAGMFRINVDGLSGKTFHDIEIRANDSIYVFAEALLPPNGQPTPQTVEASLEFVTNGVTQSVVVTATGQDVERLRGVVIERNARFDATRPYRITDSLVVAPGATLTIVPGAKLLFRDKAKLLVYGTLVAEGTPDAHITLTGDRTGEVIPGVSFDIMSRQWDGIEFYPTSTGNSISYAEISNTSYGVAVYGDGSDLQTPKVTFVNSRLRNSGECALAALNASVTALGCEFAEASSGLVYLVGGDHRFDLCTFANNYLFSAITGPAIWFADPSQMDGYEGVNPTKALVTNSIIYGLGDDVWPGDLTGRDITLARCLFRAEGTDDANFVNSLWAVDPLFYTVREDYYFDYRLQPDSPAIGAADPSLTDLPLSCDFYGTPRTLDLGAYAHQ